MTKSPPFSSISSLVFVERHRHACKWMKCAKEKQPPLKALTTRHNGTTLVWPSLSIALSAGRWICALHPAESPCFRQDCIFWAITTQLATAAGHSFMSCYLVLSTQIGWSYALRRHHVLARIKNRLHSLWKHRMLYSPFFCLCFKKKSPVVLQMNTIMFTSWVLSQSSRLNKHASLFNEKHLHFYYIIQPLLFESKIILTRSSSIPQLSNRLW